MVIAYTVFALSLGALLLFLAVRKLHHQELEQRLAEAQWEARYYQQETEIALSVSRSISNTIAARLSSVYGRDYVDYLIARQMQLQLQTPEQRQPKEQPLTINRNTAPKAIDLYADEHRADEQRRRERERAMHHHSGYTPPHQWQPQPQAPQQPTRFLQDLADDDMLDVEVYQSAPVVYPPALLTPPTAGRQRKYTNNAERQRAYRARRRKLG